MGGMADMSTVANAMVNVVERWGGYPGLKLRALFEFVSQTFPGEEKLKRRETMFCVIRCSALW